MKGREFLEQLSDCQLLCGINYFVKGNISVPKHHAIKVYKRRWDEAPCI
jgi:hypothetical protein